jgi:hypothetical protein
MEVYDEKRWGERHDTGSTNTMTDLPGQVHAVRTREDFAALAEALSRDRDGHGDEWENGDLQRYLGAIAAWTRDMDGYFANNGNAVPEEPSWNLLGQILYAARVYE